MYCIILSLQVQNPLMVHHQTTLQPDPSCCPDLFNQLWVLLHFLRSQASRVIYFWSNGGPNVPTNVPKWVAWVSDLIRVQVVLHINCLVVQ